MCGMTKHNQTSVLVSKLEEHFEIKEGCDHCICLFLYFPLFSPFKIKVLPAHDASKVRASGPGLNASGVPASLPVEFTIDARDAGEGLLTVQILVSDISTRSGLFFEMF